VNRIFLRCSFEGKGPCPTPLIKNSNLTEAQVYESMLSAAESWLLMSRPRKPGRAPDRLSLAFAKARGTSTIWRFA
jgi:hypothetical protein